MELSKLEKEYLDLVGKATGWKYVARDIVGDESKEDELKNITYKNKTIDDFIADKMGIDKSAIDELKEKEHIKACKKRYSEKIGSLKEAIKKKNNIKDNKELEDIDKKVRDSFFNGSLADFCEWYFSKKQECCYCGITQDKLNELFKSKKIQAKKTSHTATLQIDKQNPYDGYNAKNCVLACSLCNNAKSDMISATNYKKFFGEKMGEFLEKLYKEEIDNDHKPLDTESSSPIINGKL